MATKLVNFDRLSTALNGVKSYVDDKVGAGSSNGGGLNKVEYPITATSSSTYLRIAEFTQPNSTTLLNITFKNNAGTYYFNVTLLVEVDANNNANVTQLNGMWKTYSIYVPKYKIVYKSGSTIQLYLDINFYWQVGNLSVVWLDITNEVTVKDVQTTSTIPSGYSNTIITAQTGLFDNNILRKSTTSGFVKNDGSIDSNTYAKLWVGDESAYNNITSKQSNMLYCIINNSEL